MTVRTNSLGMGARTASRSATQPDLRILVAGTRTRKRCAPTRSRRQRSKLTCAQRLGGKTVEALNAGVGSSNFYNYLPVLERYRSCGPTSFIADRARRHDLSGAAPVGALLPAPRSVDRHKTKSRQPLLDSDDPFVRQLVGTEARQVMHMIAEPEDPQLSTDIALDLRGDRK